MSIIQIIGGAILAVLGWIVGTKIETWKSNKKIQKLETEKDIAEKKAVTEKNKTAAAKKQTKEVIQTFQEEVKAHEKTKENIESFQEAQKKIHKVEEEADEKTDDIINSDIDDKLKFMRNDTGDSAS